MSALTSAEACERFVGDGPDYSCLLCGQLGRDHLTIDQKRLAYVVQFIDGLGDIDFHECAASMAEIFHHSEPTEMDYYRAVCVGIDTLKRAKS